MGSGVVRRPSYDIRYAENITMADDADIAFVSLRAQWLDRLEGILLDLERAIGTGSDLVGALRSQRQALAAATDALQMRRWLEGIGASTHANWLRREAAALPADLRPLAERLAALITAAYDFGRSWLPMVEIRLSNRCLRPWTVAEAQMAGFAGEDDLLAGMRIVDAADTASLLQRFVLDRLDGQTPIAGPSPGRLEPWPASAEPVDFEATLRTLLRDDSPPILATYFGGVNTTGVVASATFLRHWWSFANGNDDIVFWPADGAWVATVTEFDIFALWRPLVAWGGCVRGLDEVRFAPAP